MTTPRNYVFYKFVCLNDDIESCYVGSTSNFKKRKSRHKFACHTEYFKDYNLKIYQTIRTNGGWDNWRMIQIGTKEQITKRQAEQIEEQYRKELKADMNERRAFRTEEERKEYNKEQHKEYYDNNKDYFKEQNKEYYDNNKEQINEQRNEKVECECGCIVARQGLLKHKKSMIHQLNLLEIGETRE